MKLSLIALSAGSLLAISAPAYAHHSFAMFDTSVTKSVTGTVTEFNWTNPHSSFAVASADAGGVAQTWYFEMNSPQNLVREGWKRSSIAPGDKVTVSYHPLRNGKPGGSYVSLVLPTGVTLGGAQVQ